MSYQVKRRQTYQPQRSVGHMLMTPRYHEDFRMQWESNFDRAVSQALALKDKGFMVDECFERGAMMESQAKREAKRLQQVGCEVELIPIAKWADENVVFMVVKPPKEGEAIYPLQPEKPQSAAKKPKEPTPEQLIQSFVKNFTDKYGNAPDPQDLKQKGYMVDPHMIAGLIDPNHPTQEALVKMYRDARTRPTPTPITFINTSKFRAALSNAKRVKGKLNIALNNVKNTIAIDNLLKALRVLGDGPIQVFIAGDEKPVYFARNGGYAVAIAPVVEPEPTLTVTLSEVEAEAHSQQ